MLTHSNSFENLLKISYKQEFFFPAFSFGIYVRKLHGIFLCSIRMPSSHPFKSTTITSMNWEKIWTKPPKVPKKFERKSIASEISKHGALTCIYMYILETPKFTNVRAPVVLFKYICCNQGICVVFVIYNLSTNNRNSYGSWFVHTRREIGLPLCRGHNYNAVWINL